MMFTGCASSKPITKSIVNEVGGINKTPLFQYYVSKKLTLNVVDHSNNSDITARGVLVRRSSTDRETIIIGEKTPGVVKIYDERPDPDGFRLGVAFENFDDDPRLSFGQYRKGNQERYYILYDDAKNRIVRYGNNQYAVNYEGSEAPYLIIKGVASDKESNRKRRVKGLRLGQ